MKTKLIASDLDKTLMKRDEARLSPIIEQDIKAALNSGTEFAVVSGRDYISLRKALASVESRVYFIGCCGALCVKDGKLLSSHPVFFDHVFQAVQTAKARKLSLVLCGKDKIYVLGSEDFKQRIRSLYESDAIFVTAPSEIKENVYKISFYSENTENPPAGFDVTPFGLRNFYRKNGWCEYVNRFASKGAALQDLQFRLGVTKAETAGAGDEVENDTDMLLRCGKAFAATPELANVTGATLFDDPHAIFSNI